MSEELQRSILHTLSYFDVFRHPLASREIFATLPTNSVTETDVQSMLDTMVGMDLIQEHEQFYFLPGRSAHLIQERNNREALAKILQKRARWVAHLFKRFPFVRAVFLTGSLSKNVAYENSDIDLLIVTAPSRVWICRTLFTIFKKLFLLNYNKYCCFNFIISEKALSIEQRNIYTAIETSTVIPLWNQAIFRQFNEANQWIFNFLPNWRFDENRTLLISSRQSLFQWFTEKCFLVLPLDQIDKKLMNMWQFIWSKRHPELSEEERKLRFQCHQDVSTRWDINYYETIRKQINN
ncbi:nucleotidyltransferase domain-containing protein [bacterium]|nr:nucleotidyltransferase domain-containing protein [bacterium]